MDKTTKIEDHPWRRTVHHGWLRNNHCLFTQKLHLPQPWGWGGLFLLHNNHHGPYIAKYHRVCIQKLMIHF